MRLQCWRLAQRGERLPQGKVGLSFVWFTAASASTHSDSVGNRYPSVKGCVELPLAVYLRIRWRQGVASAKPVAKLDGP